MCGGGSVSAAAAPRLVSPRLGLEACGVRVSASDSEDMWPLTRGGTAAQPRRRRRQNCSAARRSRRPGTSTPTGGLAAGGSPPRPCGCRGRCSVQRYARGAAVARSTPSRAVAGSVVRGMAGSSPLHDVAIKKGRNTIGRVYCRNTKLRNGEARWGNLRFERAHRFTWREARRLEDLHTEAVAAVFWGSVFGQGRAAGRVTRAVSRLAQLPGQGSSAQPGRKLYAERDRFGKWQHRRALAKEFGVSPADTEVERLDVSLDELLEVPRSAWAA